MTREQPIYPLFDQMFGQMFEQMFTSRYPARATVTVDSQHNKGVITYGLDTAENMDKRTADLG